MQVQIPKFKIVNLTIFFILISLFSSLYSDPGDDLLEAAFNGDLKKAEVAIQSGADTNRGLMKKIKSPKFKHNKLIYFEGSTPLTISSGEGYFKIANLLIKNKANVNAADYNGSTSLIYASVAGHIKIAKLLIENNADLNSENIDERTPLMLATINNRLDFVELLTGRNAEINLSDNVGNTALMFSAKNGNMDIAKHLLEKNANINLRNIFGESALILALENSHRELAKYLLEKNAESRIQTVKTFSSDEMYLFEIANAKGYSEIAEIIKNKNIDLFNKSEDVSREEKNYSANQSLIEASEKNLLKMAEEALQSGADINYEIKSEGPTKGATPLISATFYQHAEMVKFLLDHNADIRLSNPKTLEVMRYANPAISKLLIEKNPELRIVIMAQDFELAIKSGEAQKVQELLNYNLPDNIKDEALHNAISSGKIEIIELLIKNNANVNSKLKEKESNYKYGITPLMKAIQSNRLDVVKLLVNNKAKVENRIECNNCELKNKTALSFALENKNPEIMNFLLDNIADAKERKNLLHFAFQGVRDLKDISFLLNYDFELQEDDYFALVGKEKYESFKYTFLKRNYFNFNTEDNSELYIKFLKLFNEMYRLDDQNRKDYIKLTSDLFENQLSKENKKNKIICYSTILWFIYQSQDNIKYQNINEIDNNAQFKSMIQNIAYPCPDIYFLLGMYYSVIKDFDLSNKYLSLSNKLKRISLIKLKNKKEFDYYFTQSLILKKGLPYIQYSENTNPRLLIQYSHSNAIDHIAISPDNKTIITSSEFIAKLWNMDGKLLAEIFSTNEKIKNVVFSPNSKYIYIVLKDVIQIWNLNGNYVDEIQGDKIYFAPGEKIITALNYSKKLLFWNYEGKYLYELELDNSNYYFSTDMKFIAFCSNDIVEFKNLNGETIFKLTGQKEKIDEVFFSSSGKYIATVARYKSIAIWKNTGELLSIIQTPNIESYSYFRQLNFFSEEKYLLVKYEKKEIIYNLKGEVIEKNKIIRDKLYTPEHEIIKELIFSQSIKDHNGNSDCSYFSTGKNSITLINEYLFDVFKIRGLAISKILKNFKKNIDFISISKDMKKMVIVSGNSLEIWNLNDNAVSSVKSLFINEDRIEQFIKRLARIEDKDIDSYDNSLSKLMENSLYSRVYKKIYFIENRKLHFSLSEKSIIESKRREKILKIRNLDDTKSIIIKTGIPKGNPEKIEQFFFSQDKKIFATTHKDNTVKIWNWKGNLITILRGHTSEIVSVNFSYDGKKVGTASMDNTAKIWDLSGNLLNNLSGNQREVIYVCFSPDGKRIATSHLDKTVRLWNGDGKLIAELFGNITPVVQCLFSPDSSILATRAIFNTTFKVWDRDGNLLESIHGHGAGISDLTFSPDSQFIITSSYDNSSKIWNREWKEINSFPEGNILIFSPDKKNIIQVVENKINIYDMSGNLQSETQYNSIISNIEFSSDKKILMTTHFDNTIVFRDFESQKIVATLLVLNNGGNIIFTPDNYYMVTSQDSLKYVSFKKEGKIYDFDQFDLKFNRPDIIMERMKPLFLDKKNDDESEESYRDRVQDYENKITLYKNYYEFRIKQNGFKPEHLSGENKIHAPEISRVKVNKKNVETDNFNSEISDRKIKLSFFIQDEQGSNLNIVGYKIFVKGVPLHGQYMKKFDNPEPSKKIEEEITLSALADIGDNPGDNSIELLGYTSDGIESNKYKIHLKYTGNELEKKGNLYIVTLGTKKYQSSGKSDLFDLTYPVKDAEDLQKLFQEKNKEEKIYNKIIPIFYADEEISRKKLNSIRKELNKTSVDDTVIFFISGHGVRADTKHNVAEKLAKEFGIIQSIGDSSNSNDSVNVYYYMTSNSNATKPWENGIPMEAFRFALNEIKARQKILLLDTCQSGEKVVLSGYKPSKLRMEEIEKLKESYNNQAEEKGIRRIKGSAEEELQNYLISIAYEWELRELSKMFPELRRGTGTIEISAASGTQSALESDDWKNGAFTFTIKEAILNDKAKEGDNITGKSLRKYILNRVERLTKGRQIPMVTRDIPGRDFRVAK